MLHTIKCSQEKRILVSRTVFKVIKEVSTKYYIEESKMFPNV
jgi:hypothetical protein